MARDIIVQILNSYDIFVPPQCVNRSPVQPWSPRNGTAGADAKPVLSNILLRSSSGHHKQLP